MSILTTLVHRLRAFDEAAWVSLANRGLYRRALKDLEQAAPSLSDHASHVEIAFAGQRIRIASADPRSALCDCRAPSACQHRLAALIWLQRQAWLPGDEAQGACPEVATVDYEALLAIDDAALKVHAGAAGYRWALNYAADLDLTRDFRIIEGRYPVLQLPRLGFELRCIGADLSQMLTRPETTATKKHTAAALLALRRAHGQTLPAVEESIVSNDAAARQRMLAEVALFARETIDIGIAHPSPSMQQHADALASWAQSLGCTRLAATLRRCADQIEASCARLAHSDSEDLLDELALAFALAEALQQASADGSAQRAPRELYGATRRQYEESDALELAALAAWPFLTASGFKGLSVLFYAPADGEFLTLTDARAASTLFDPLARFEQGGPWRGMACPRALLGCAVVVQNARRADGRLSASDETRVDTVRALAGDDRSLPPAIDDWRELAMLESASILRGGADRFFLLRPTRWQRAHFDPHRQVLHWRHHDAQGSTLTLTLPYSPLQARAVAAFEHYSAQPATGLIIARQRGADLEPLGWLRAEGQTWRAGTPYFDQAVGEAGALADPHRSNNSEPPALSRLRATLQRTAERGVSQGRNAELASLQRHANGLGLMQFAAVLDPDSGAVAVLRGWLFLRQLQAELLSR